MGRNGTVYYRNGQKGQTEFYGELKSLPWNGDNLIGKSIMNHKEASWLNRRTTGRDQPQLNLDEPPEEPQEEDDSDPFEEEKPERIFSGFFAPQAGQVKDSPSSLTF